MTAITSISSSGPYLDKSPSAADAHNLLGLPRQAATLFTARPASSTAFVRLGSPSPVPLPVSLPVSFDFPCAPSTLPPVATPFRTSGAAAAVSPPSYTERTRAHSAPLPIPDDATRGVSTDGAYAETQLRPTPCGFIDDGHVFFIPGSPLPPSTPAKAPSALTQLALAALQHPSS